MRLICITRKVMTNLDSIFKSREIILPTKFHLVKATVFPVVMYGCESWTVKKAERQRMDEFELWCWRRLLRVPWTARRSNQIHSVWDQPWDFFGGNDAKAETPVLWPSHAKSWLIGKDSDAGRDWGQEEKGMTEDEMAGWHYWLGGCEFEWTPGVGDGQGGLACCNSWGCKELDMTDQLNWLNHLRPYLSHFQDLPCGHLVFSMKKTFYIIQIFISRSIKHISVFTMSRKDLDSHEEGKCLTWS